MDNFIAKLILFIYLYLQSYLINYYYYCYYYYYSKFCDNLFFLFFQAVKLQPCIIFIDEIGKHKGFLHQLM